MNDIRNYNSKKESHGYQEWHRGDAIWLRANYKNNQFIGYNEIHRMKKTKFNIR